MELIARSIIRVCPASIEYREADVGGFHTSHYAFVIHHEDVDEVRQGNRDDAIGMLINHLLGHEPKRMTSTMSDFQDWETVVFADYDMSDQTMQILSEPSDDHRFEQLITLGRFCDVLRQQGLVRYDRWGTPVIRS